MQIGFNIYLSNRVCWFLEDQDVQSLHGKLNVIMRNSCTKYSSTSNSEEDTFLNLGILTNQRHWLPWQRPWYFLIGPQTSSKLEVCRNFKELILTNYIHFTKKWLNNMVVLWNSAYPNFQYYWNTVTITTVLLTLHYLVLTSARVFLNF